MMLNLFDFPHYGWYRGVVILTGTMSFGGVVFELINKFLDKYKIENIENH